MIRRPPTGSPDQERCRYFPVCGRMPGSGTRRWVTETGWPALFSRFSHDQEVRLISVVDRLCGFGLSCVFWGRAHRPPGHGSRKPHRLRYTNLQLPLLRTDRVGASDGAVQQERLCFYLGGGCCARIDGGTDYVDKNNLMVHYDEWTSRGMPEKGVPSRLSDPSRDP